VARTSGWINFEDRQAGDVEVRSTAYIVSAHFDIEESGKWSDGEASRSIHIAAADIGRHWTKSRRTVGDIRQQMPWMQQHL